MIIDRIIPVEGRIAKDRILDTIIKLYYIHMDNINAEKDVLSSSHLAEHMELYKDVALPVRRFKKRVSTEQIYTSMSDKLDKILKDKADGRSKH